MLRKFDSPTNTYVSIETNGIAEQQSRMKWEIQDEKKKKRMEEAATFYIQVNWNLHFNFCFLLFKLFFERLLLLTVKALHTVKSDIVCSQCISIE